MTARVVVHSKKMESKKIKKIKIKTVTGVGGMNRLKLQEKSSRRRKKIAVRERWVSRPRIIAARIYLCHQRMPRQAGRQAGRHGGRTLSVSEACCALQEL